MQPCISVIVPVYKVEPYLRQCVESIMNQTYSYLEIILVDDGSPDNCGAICDEYARKDSRIRVIHKENGGLSDARNAGLDIAAGDYIGFVDSDDWIEPQMYEKLLELLLKYGADMAFGGVADDVVSDGKAQTVKVSDYGNAPFSEDKLSAMCQYFQGSWAAWDKLYRRKLFDGIRFPVGEINEDEAIVLRLLDRCERVCYTNKVCYHYLKHTDGNSITSSAFSAKKLDWVKHCRDNLTFIREKYPELEIYALQRYRSSLLWSLSEIALQNTGYDLEWKNLKRELTASLGILWRSGNTRDKLLVLLFAGCPRPVCRFLIRKWRAG